MVKFNANSLLTKTYFEFFTVIQKIMEKCNDPRDLKF